MPWSPTLVTASPWGYVQVVVDGVDVTFIRGVRAKLGRVTLQEPYAEGPADVTFPSMTRWDIGASGFEWFREGADVELNHLDASRAFVRNLWAGFVASPDLDDGVPSLYLDGALAGQAALHANQPPLFLQTRDLGQAIAYALRYHQSRYTFPIPNLGITTDKRGARNQMALDFVDSLLQDAYTEAGEQWTIRRVGLRAYDMALKDVTTVHATITLGARGVRESLRRDLSESPNAVYAEWVTPNGCRGRNAKFPNIAGTETVPTYPVTGLILGQLDSETPSGQDVTLWQQEVYSQGWRPDPRTDADADPSTIDAVFNDNCVLVAKAIQKAAGLPITGAVDSATWKASWNVDVTGASQAFALFLPIATDPRVERWLYSANGSILGENPAYDASIMRVETFVSYGEGVWGTYAQQSAQQLIDQGGHWYGTVELRTDPPEMHRLDLTEGMNVSLVGLGTTPVLVHVAKVEQNHSDPGWPVTLTVDTRGRDLITVAAMIDRDNQARQDPARSYVATRRKSATTADSLTVWDCDAGAGVIAPLKVTGGHWAVRQILGAQAGTLRAVEAWSYTPKAKFVLAVFGAPVTAAQLDARFPAPLTARSDKYGPWDVPGDQAQLAIWNLIEVFGGPGQAAGYSPGYETAPDGTGTAHPITGHLNVESSSSFVSDYPPLLWVAVWSPTTCTVRGQLKAEAAE